MGRNRLHANNADRQMAYRLRIAQTARTPSKGRRPTSKPKLLAMVQRVTDELQSEYEGWLESLPESLRETAQAERLEETIEQLTAVADLLSEIQLPKGYGRD